MKGGIPVNKTEKRVKEIKESLLEQLKMLNMTGNHYLDMIDDYCQLFKLREKLEADIDENGIRYTVVNGNGFESEKPNESIGNRVKVNAQMLKILGDLNLKQPDQKGKANAYRK
jgi:predicted MPP superfamily phosphohydrolase